jgi:hypothetical protein
MSGQTSIVVQCDQHVSVVEVPLSNTRNFHLPYRLVRNGTSQLHLCSNRVIDPAEQNTPDELKTLGPLKDVIQFLRYQIWVVSLDFVKGISLLSPILSCLDGKMNNIVTCQRRAGALRCT